MKLRPVDERSRPGYPTMDELLSAEDGTGVRERVGGKERRGWGLRGWRTDWGKGLAGAAVFFLAFHVSGCDTGDTVGPTVVAPVFEHGVGRGAWGCVVMTPPTFLSEEEAMAVIKDELGKHGVSLGEGGVLKDVIVQIPCHDPFDFGEPKKDKRLKLIDPRPLDVDAIDGRKSVAVVFVSMPDCENFELPMDGIPLVSSLTPKKVASDLAASARRSGDQKRYIGFFYDPFGKPDENEEARERPADEEEGLFSQDDCKELLREQVRDFAGWLEEQGVEVQHAGKPATPKKSN